MTFDDNMEITQMISDEDERVSLVRKINPQAANVCCCLLSCFISY